MMSVTERNGVNKQFCVELTKRDGGEIIKLNWSKRPVKPARFYGKFTCRNLHCQLNTWSSAYIWLGRGQKCKLCDNLIPPASVEELRRKEDKSRTPAKPAYKLGEKKHDYTKCGYCLERRSNCTKIPSSEYGSYSHAIII